MKKSQCEYCLYLTYDEELGEDYCSMSLDQDEIARLRYSSHNGCPYFRMGDDYTIVRKQAF